MDDFDSIINQLKDSSGELKHNLHVLEEIIPIEEQMRYFEYSKRIRAEHEYVNRDYLIARLFSPDVDEIEDKRYCLSMLAGLIDIAAYRCIETYHSSPLEPELANWSALALMESRILLDSDLSGEKQFLVSTGLGGMKGMLRFFVVVATKNRTDFTELQYEVVNREFNFGFNHENIVIEDFSIKNNYFKIILLSGLNHDLKVIIRDIVAECNELGDFLDSKFLLTNVRLFQDSEIEKLLQNRK